MFAGRVEKASYRVERHGVRLSAAFLIRGPCRQAVPTLLGLPRELKPHPAILSTGSGERGPLPTLAASAAPMNRTDWAAGEAGVPAQLWLSRRDLCVPRQCRTNLDGTFSVRFASAWPCIAFYTHNSVLRATCRYRVETWISLTRPALQAPAYAGTINPAGQP